MSLRPSEPQVLTDRYFLTFVDISGRIIDEYNLRKWIFFRGINGNALRCKIWKFLLNVYSWTSTYEERAHFDERRHAEYVTLKQHWSNAVNYNDEFAQAKRIIEKDVPRTDRHIDVFQDVNGHGLQVLRSVLLTYAIHNPTIGYCQGMNDLLAPLIIVMGGDNCNEEDVFWLFEGLMKRTAGNFSTNHTCITEQLELMKRLTEHVDLPLHTFLVSGGANGFFFCYRWILLSFKREFHMDDLIQLWERIWADFSTSQFHLVIAMSMLILNRDHIMSCSDADEVIKIVNGLSMKFCIDDVILEGQRILHHLKTERKSPWELNSIRNDTVIAPPMVGFTASLRQNSTIPSKVISADSVSVPMPLLSAFPQAPPPSELILTAENKAAKDGGSNPYSASSHRNAVYNKRTVQSQQQHMWNPYELKPPPIDVQVQLQQHYQPTPLTASSSLQQTDYYNPYSYGTSTTTLASPSSSPTLCRNDAMRGDVPDVPSLLEYIPAGKSSPELNFDDSDLDNENRDELCSPKRFIDMNRDPQQYELIEDEVNSFAFPSFSKDEQQQNDHPVIPCSNRSTPPQQTVDSLPLSKSGVMSVPLHNGDNTRAENLQWTMGSLLPPGPPPASDLVVVDDYIPPRQYGY